MKCKNPKNEIELELMKELEKEILVADEECTGIIFGAGFKDVRCVAGASGDEITIIATIATLIFNMSSDPTFSLDIDEIMRILNEDIRTIKKFTKDMY